MELKIDMEREQLFANGELQPTNIYVRAQYPDGTWESADIAYITRESLWTWLRSRGGNNPWAENVVLLMLGHQAMEDTQVPF